MAEPDSSNITDATDWVSTPLHKLSALEAALRCQICRDFFTDPVITSCSHTFCSLCIRRCLCNEGKCPTCRTPDQATKLRRNWAMQEGVDAWAKARGDVLVTARLASLNGSPQKDNKLGNVLSPGLKRRSLDDASERGSETPEGTKRLRSSTRSKPVTHSHGEDDITPLDAYRNIDGNSVVTDHTDNAPATLPQPLSSSEPDDGLVACPVCNRRMKIDLVFPHLDKCPGTPQQGQDANGPVSTSTTSNSSKPSLPSIFSPTLPALLFGPGRRLPPHTPQPLPSLNYNLLNDRTLRQKLSMMGIPSCGSRQQMLRRHTEWVNLWNANCDSLNPKSKRELLHDLDQWERTQGSINDDGLDISQKDFDKDSWMKTHQDSFRRLIEQAKRGKYNDMGPASAKRAANPVAPSPCDGTSTSPTSNANGQETQSRSEEEPLSPVPSPAWFASPDGTVKAGTTQPSTVRSHDQPPQPSGNPAETVAHKPSNQQQPTTLPTPTSFAQSVDPIEDMRPQGGRRESVAYKPPNQQQPTTLPTPTSFAQSVDPIENVTPQETRRESVAYRPPSQQQPTTLPTPTSFAQSVDPIEDVKPQEGRRESVAYRPLNQQQPTTLPTPTSFAQSVDPIEGDKPQRRESVAYRPLNQQQPTTLLTPTSFAQSVDPIENEEPQRRESVAYRPLNQQQPTTLPTPTSFAQSVDPIENEEPQRRESVAYRPLSQQQPTTLPTPTSFAQSVDPIENERPQRRESVAYRPLSQQQPTTLPTPKSFAQSVDPIEDTKATAGQESQGREALGPLHTGGQQQQQQSIPRPSPLSFAKSLDPIGVSPSNDANGTMQQSPEDGLLDQVPGTPPMEGSGDSNEARGMSQFGLNPGIKTDEQLRGRRTRRRNAKRQ